MTFLLYLLFTEPLPLLGGFEGGSYFTTNFLPERM